MYKYTVFENLNNNTRFFTSYVGNSNFDTVNLKIIKNTITLKSAQKHCTVKFECATQLFSVDFKPYFRYGLNMVLSL